MASHESGIFSRLPGSILEAILIQLDLSSLHNLYRSSSTIFPLLHDRGIARRNIEIILQLRVPNEAQIAIRKFDFLRWAFLQWDTRSFPDVNCFIQEFIEQDKDIRYKSIPYEMPLSVLFDVLSTAATIFYLAHDSLHKMIDRCSSLELSRMKDFRKRYIPKRRDWKVKKETKWAKYFPNPKTTGEQYYQAEMGPISLLEEQRAIRALWRLFLIWELHNGVIDSRQPQPRWAPTEIDRLQTLSFDITWAHAKARLGHSLWSNGILEEIRTMADCLSPSLSTPIQRYRAVKSLAYSAGWHSQCECLPTIWPLQENKDDQLDLRFMFPPWAWGFVTITLSHLFTSPCKYVKFASYRRYGFAIWDSRRFWDLGLLYKHEEERSESPRGGIKDREDPNFQGPRSDDDQYFRWESMLSADDLEGIERMRKKFWGREIHMDTDEDYEIHVVHMDTRNTEEYLALVNATHSVE
ncbi:hypothetical protein N7495_003251 [Penicillium taxi]|uniref:uncharacterized protein n=1 Tax=Penicillium taxi TaxID=168475 RepID=UPI0025452ADD|nr:uncharacterized protein N7495_003251 [Penicillium taxi]KAJ5902723.1 hypothetical protein N7495_003251 [Penicillium taxi]